MVETVENIFWDFVYLYVPAMLSIFVIATIMFVWTVVLPMLLILTIWERIPA